MPVLDMDGTGTAESVLEPSAVLIIQSPFQKSVVWQTMCKSPVVYLCVCLYARRSPPASWMRSECMFLFLPHQHTLKKVFFFYFQSTFINQGYNQNGSNCL